MRCIVLYGCNAVHCTRCEHCDGTVTALYSGGPYCGAVKCCKWLYSAVQLLDNLLMYVNDNHPGLLAYLFPHLDLWGIGGFHHPGQQHSQRLSFEAQVKCLMHQY